MASQKQTPECGDAKQTPESGDVKQTPESGDAKQTPESGDATQTPESGDAKQTPESGDAASLLADCAGFDYVRFTFASIVGGAYAKSIPIRHLQRYLQNGTSYVWEGTSLLDTRSETYPEMFNVIGTGNVDLIPIAGTAYPLPWVTGKYKVGAVLCEVGSREGGAAPTADVRAVARRQLQRLEDHGYSLRSGAEVKFVLMDGSSGRPVEEESAYATVCGLSRMEGFLYRVDDMLLQCGVDVENILQEMYPGMYELVLASSLGIAGADHVFKVRHALREIAAQHDMIACFMTKPFHNVGTEIHFNHSICDRDQRNLFYDASAADHVSEFAGAWLGGLVKHMAALTALCCPTVNCFRRIGAPWAPTNADWGVDDRKAAIRLRCTNTGNTFLENRLPSGAANPYIVLAATVAAGLDGVLGKLPCPPPMDATAPLLPHSLEEALAALKADAVICAALGEKFIHWFLTEKTGSQLPRFPHWKKEDSSEQHFAKEREFFMKYI